MSAMGSNAALGFQAGIGHWASDRKTDAAGFRYGLKPDLVLGVFLPSGLGEMKGYGEYHRCDLRRSSRRVGVSKAVAGRTALGRLRSSGSKPQGDIGLQIRKQTLPVSAKGGKRTFTYSIMLKRTVVPSGRSLIRWNRSAVRENHSCH